jgi:hypothetical protein
MTRNDVLTSSRMHQIGAGSTSGGDDRRRMRMRWLPALVAVLALALTMAAPALAAGPTGTEGLSGYKHKETPKHETQPSKTTKEPTVEPAKAVEPVAKASSLPFTGFNLTWTVGFGVLLVGAGGSIVLMQRRRQESGR